MQSITIDSHNNVKWKIPFLCLFLFLELNRFLFLIQFLKFFFILFIMSSTNLFGMHLVYCNATFFQNPEITSNHNNDKWWNKPSKDSKSHYFGPHYFGNSKVIKSKNNNNKPPRKQIEIRINVPQIEFHFGEKSSRFIGDNHAFNHLQECIIISVNNQKCFYHYFSNVFHISNVYHINNVSQDNIKLIGTHWFCK